ncbi:uncharacterized protein LOC134814427 [Bolinopsis microptera]|uniref:uncharacterized protein LOC134814427 n=1 Tax=Bolinopsis microptera TaxID=2820187 RepID=UPI00307ADE85
MHYNLLLLILSAFKLAEGGLFDSTTRNTLEGIAFPYSNQQFVMGNGTEYMGRQASECYGEAADTVVSAIPQTNNFLDLVNFMEFIQQTKAGAAQKGDAGNFYQVAKAAMVSGNTFVAQENMARALGAIESYNKRRKRSDDEGSWSAQDLFDEFRNSVGEEKFKDVLHLNKKVTMAFVIDTSSSMKDDMKNVRAYIQQLILEQQKAGVEAEFIVTTFADNPATIRTFKTSHDIMRYIQNLTPSVGGDCEERTCYGILSTLYRSTFMRVRNSVMYVFTDATSKDCFRSASSIMRSLAFLKAPVFFILFDSCKPTIDSNYVKMAHNTGGFCLLLKENGVYNVTDTVNGAFDKDALICGEESDNALSVVGQGAIDNSRKKRSAAEDGEVSEKLEKSLLVDTSMEKFKVIATITPASLLNKVSLEKPADGDSARCGNLRSGEPNIKIAESVADNTVIFDVTAESCPCTGEWKVKYPEEASSFTYSVKSSGEYLVAFEAYFVDETGPNRIANYAPCLGIEENLVIKLNQGEKVNTNTLYAKLVGVAGNVVHWRGALATDKQADNAFVVTLTIPPDMGTEGFRIVLGGEIVDGTKFQRVSPNYFHPTSSCLRITDVGNFYALSPNRKTYIKVQVTNNNAYEELYLLSCSNTENYDVTIGFPLITSPDKKDKRARSNPVVLKSKQTAEFTVNVAAPRNTKEGRIVSVTCKVTASADELIDMVRLTEIPERFGKLSG